ncbi:MAG: hypothetical protein AB3X46_01750 [Leptothrix ochracea]|uniref:hypothetical protein n=2 Tax=Leptothrix ochracea TaxID=735331 RepID=UPI0034E1B453
MSAALTEHPTSAVDLQKENGSTIRAESTDFLKNLTAECESMLHYAVGQAIKIPDELTHVLEHLDKKQPRLTLANTVKLHNRLADVVAPAMPHAIHTLMTDPHKGSLLGIFGPLPNVRYLIVAALFFTAMFVATSLSSHVNYRNLEAGIYSMSGWELFVVLMFLMSASGLGACFNALFASYRYVSNATYDTRYDSSYWIRIILGLMAGLVMSQVISLESLTSFQTVTVEAATAPQAASAPQEGASSAVALAEQGGQHDKDQSAGKLKDHPPAGGVAFGKPLLALLGGFSAAMVYTVLQRLVETVESLFKSGGGEAAVIQKEAAMRSKMERQLSESRMAISGDLIALNEAIKNGASQEYVANLAAKALENIRPSRESGSGISVEGPNKAA